MIEIKSKRVKAIIDFCVVHYKKGDFDLNNICFLCLCLLNDLTQRVGGIGGKNYLKIYF